jgi:hypothetical protein
MEEKTQTMNTSLPPADTQVTTERQTTECVNTASTDSLSHPKK